jgi:hypothetical protein
LDDLLNTFKELKDNFTPDPDVNLTLEPATAAAEGGASEE